MNAINEQWLRTYQLIKNYYKVYKTLDIPYFYEINGIKLRRWLTE